MRPLLLPILLSLSLLSGCATSMGSSSYPAWMDSSYDKSYDQDTYLAAVGSGSTREQAVDNARAALSQIFKSEVRSVTELTTLSTSSTDEAGQSTFTQAFEMLEMGRVSSTTEELIGSEVANVFTDSLGRVHARVVVHRKKSADVYRERAGELARERSAMRTKRLLTGDPLRQYILLLEELSLATQEQGFLDQIQVLSGTRQSQVLLPLRQELGRLASTIVVSVNVDAPEGAKATLQSAYEAAFQSLGFSTTDGRAAYEADVYYRDEEVVMEGSPYHYVRYTLALQLKGDETVYLSHQSGSREAALGKEEAAQRALRSASNDGVQEFVVLLLQSLAVQ